MCRAMRSSSVKCYNKCFLMSALFRGVSFMLISIKGWCGGFVPQQQYSMMINAGIHFTK